MLVATSPDLRHLTAVPYEIARALLLISALYIAVGALVAPFFMWRGVRRIDAAAGDAPFLCKALLLPGVAALWPWIVVRWYRTKGECRS